MKLTLFKGENLPINYPTEKIILTAIAENKKTSFDYILFNFNTLVRNFITALSYEEEITDKSKRKYKELKGGEYLAYYYKMFKKDLELINTILNDNKIKPIYYYKDYRKIKKCLLNYLSIEDMPPMKAIAEKYSKSFRQPIIDEALIRVDNSFRDISGERYLIVTHNAADLTKYQYRNNIRLVESFTGEIKPYSKWYTKYHKIGDNDMSIFPFNGFLLTVLGCNNYIKPGKIKLRKLLYKYAKEGRWNSLTGITRIRSYLSVKDPMLYNILKDKEICYKNI